MSKQHPFRPFGGRTPYSKASGAFLPLVDQRMVRVFVLEAGYGDYVIATTGDVIAKPYLLRRYAFDGKQVVFPGITVSYVYGSNAVRVASQVVEEGEDPDYEDETQVITPSYFVGDQIMAVKSEEVTIWYESGDTRWTMRTKWVDMNTAGRAWAVEA